MNRKTTTKRMMTKSQMNAIDWMQHQQRLWQCQGWRACWAVGCWEELLDCSTV